MRIERFSCHDCASFERDTRCAFPWLVFQGERRRNRSVEVSILLLIATTVSKDMQNVDHAPTYTLWVS